RNRLAIVTASRPTTWSAASITYHRGWTVWRLAMNVDMVRSASIRPRVRPGKRVTSGTSPEDCHATPSGRGVKPAPGKAFAHTAELVYRESPIPENSDGHQREPPRDRVPPLRAPVRDRPRVHVGPDLLVLLDHPPVARAAGDHRAARPLL